MNWLNEGVKPAEPDLMNPPTIYLIKQLELAVRFRLDGILANSPLSAVQYTLMSELVARPEATGAELARRWHLTPQSISEIIVALERAGYVSRRPSTANRRRLQISLTSEGLRVLQTIQTSVAQLDDEMFAGQPIEARRTVRAQLRAARRALDDMEA